MHDTSNERLSIALFFEDLQRLEDRFLSSKKRDVIMTVVGCDDGDDEDEADDA